MDEKLSPESLADAIKNIPCISTIIQADDSKKFFDESSDDDTDCDCQSAGEISEHSDCEDVQHMMLDWVHLNSSVQLYRAHQQSFTDSTDLKVLTIKKLSHLLQVENRKEWPVEWYKLDTRSSQDPSIEWTDDDYQLKVNYHAIDADAMAKLNRPLNSSMSTNDLYEHLQDVLNTDVLGGDSLSLDDSVEQLQTVLNGFVIRRMLKYGFVRDSKTENLYQAIERAIPIIVRLVGHVHLRITTQDVRSAITAYSKQVHDKDHRSE